MRGEQRGICDPDTCPSPLTKEPMGWGEPPSPEAGQRCMTQLSSGWGYVRLSQDHLLRQLQSH